MFGRDVATFERFEPVLGDRLLLSTPVAFLLALVPFLLRELARVHCHRL